MPPSFKLLLRRKTLVLGVAGLALGGALVFATGLVSGGFWVLFEDLGQPRGLPAGELEAHRGELQATRDRAVASERLLRRQLAQVEEIERALRRELEEARGAAGDAEAWAAGGGTVGARRAVVADPCLNLRARPDVGAPALDCLEPSSRVTLLDPVPGWSRVRTPAGREGWVARSFLGAPSETSRLARAEPAAEEGAAVPPVEAPPEAAEPQALARAEALVARDEPQPAPPEPEPEVPTPAEALAVRDEPPAPPESAPPEPELAEPEAPVRAEALAARDEPPAAPPQPAAEGGIALASYRSEGAEVYRVQVASRRNPEVARRELETVKERYAHILRDVPARLQEADLGARGTWHRVQLGEFDGFSQARRLCTALEAEGLDCMVIATGR